GTAPSRRPPSRGPLLPRPERRERRAVAVDPGELDRKPDPDGLARTGDDGAREAQPGLLFELDRDDRMRPLRVVGAGRRGALVEAHREGDHAAARNLRRLDARRPALGADRLRRMVEASAVEAAVELQPAL